MKLYTLEHFGLTWLIEQRFRLGHSIAHWERLSRCPTSEESPGADGCACCGYTSRRYCGDCVIDRATGKSGCKGISWIVASGTLRTYRHEDAYGISLRGVQERDPHLSYWQHAQHAGAKLVDDLIAVYDHVDATIRELRGRKGT